MTKNDTTTGLLGDTPHRSYGTKLLLFNQFAEPELTVVVAELGLTNGNRVLDAGCGVGLTTQWLAKRVAPDGVVVGLDLAADHVRHARAGVENGALPVKVIQGDVQCPPMRPGAFDLVWSSNTINHLRKPIEGIGELARLLRRGGRLVLGQSSLLPDMFFAWDARLEQKVMLACRRYYREKYGLREEDLAAARRIFGAVRETGLRDVTVRTVVIERVAPLSIHDERYFCEVVIDGTWGQRLRPYLAEEDWAEVERLCNPASESFFLRRPDFHHVQTFTVVTAMRA